MRILVLIAAVVLASASAQAGESRSLSAYPVSDTTSAVPGQSAASKSLRADNDTPAAPPAETPRYAPPADAAPNPPPAEETPHYTARPAPVGNAPRATKATTATTVTPPTHASSDDYSPREGRGRHTMRAERGHHYRLTAGRIIAALHHYGIYW
jgi:hypothetical protein